ncbi:MAG: sigma-54-dependent Fis family transcriptional regulator [Nitrospinae bacterium]|nr:sigma-54-dependent Fis family transcriptional regulator [Nitrospinota bacterium]
MGDHPLLPVVLVDDEPHMLESCSASLRMAGINNIIKISNSREVLPLLESRDVEVVVLDLSMPSLSGSELTQAITETWPDIPVIVLTANSDLNIAVDLMKLGAFDYIVKPAENSRFTSAVARAVELCELRRQNSSLKQYLVNDELKDPSAFSGIVTTSKSMRAIFQYVESIAPTNRPVLISGETGVGKELVARVIHKISGRKGKFVAVNAAGLDDTLFSDALFGHRRGAFTGADQERKGLVETASGGTLFLDEIGDLEQASQIKLLRLIQQGEYYPLGSDLPKAANARLVMATNHDMLSLQRSGKFRKDLYYRISPHQINIPPLRGRREDLPALIDHCLGEAAQALEKKRPRPPAELATLLSVYHFPGNIRELQGMIYDAVSRHAGGTLSLSSFRLAIGAAESTGEYPKGLSPSEDTPQAAIQIDDNSGRFPTLKETERFVINEAMRRCKGNQTIAAKLLGMTRSALNKRLSREAD